MKKYIFIILIAIIGFGMSANAQQKKNIDGGSGYVTVTYADKDKNGMRVLVNNYSANCTFVALYYENTDLAMPAVQVPAWCKYYVYISNSNDIPNVDFNRIQIRSAKNKVVAVSMNACECSTRQNIKIK
jgi:hypothetical protein